MLAFVILFTISLASAQLPRSCKSDFDCQRDQVCDRPQTYIDLTTCLDSKGLNEVCQTNRQCQKRNAFSTCEYEYHWSSQLSVSLCKCRASMKEIGGKCVDYDYCRYASDCGGGEYYECRYNTCTYRSKSSNASYFIGSVIFSVGFLVTTLMCCSANRRVRVVRRVPMHGVAALHVPPSRSVPQGGAAPFVSTVSMLTSSRPMQEDMPPPAYASVVKPGDTYPKASYDNPTFQN
ncbi:hypothetical protein HDE_10856 [Halotydeus destructor]|nr:hypothetical protein HDE_10856 [Halotydeus destructor]